MKTYKNGKATLVLNDGERVSVVLSDADGPEGPLVTFPSLPDHRPVHLFFLFPMVVRVEQGDN